MLLATLEAEKTKAKSVTMPPSPTPKPTDVEMSGSPNTGPKSEPAPETVLTGPQPQQRIGLDEFYLPKGNQGFYELANLLADMRGLLLEALATSYQTTSTTGSLPMAHISLIAKFLEFLATLNKNNTCNLAPSIMGNLPPYSALGIAWHLTGTNSSSLSKDDYIWLLDLLDSLKDVSPLAMDPATGPGIWPARNISIVPEKKLMPQITSKIGRAHV